MKRKPGRVEFMRGTGAGEVDGGNGEIVCNSGNAHSDRSPFVSVISLRLRVEASSRREPHWYAGLPWKQHLRCGKARRLPFAHGFAHSGATGARGLGRLRPFRGNRFSGRTGSNSLGKIGGTENPCGNPLAAGAACAMRGRKGSCCD
jgi:hypothetical protein